MQYSQFSVISGFRHKTVHLSRKLLAVLAPPPATTPNYTKLKLGKNLDTSIHSFLWGGAGEGVEHV